MVSFELSKEIKKKKKKNFVRDSSWGLRIVSLFHPHDKTKNIFLQSGS